MKNFDSYYDPPEDPPYCEYFCGQTLEREDDGSWTCPNKFCPSKFQGIEQEMAFALVDALEDVKIYKRYKRFYVDLLEITKTQNNLNK